MIERIEHVDGGMMIEGTITLSDDMPAGVIYAQIFEEVKEMLVKHAFEGDDSIVYPDTETEGH